MLLNNEADRAISHSTLVMQISLFHVKHLSPPTVNINKPR